VNEVRSWLGNPGEAVPIVDVADLKSVWTVYRETQAREPGGGAHVAMHFLQQVCGPEANVQAVVHRSWMILMLDQIPGDPIASWRRSGELHQAVFTVAAQMPLEWMERGVPRNSLPFDLGAFLAELGMASSTG
jgi:hypothetical protein